MKHSDSIANLAAALVKAQGDIRPVGKDSVNPHFKNRYSSLDSIIDMVRPALAKHGLAVVQGAVVPETDEGGTLRCFTVETMLVHSSGEWLSNGAVIPMAKADPQGAGAALTYGRRYALSALLSISTDEDDDGNHASVPTNHAAVPASRPADSRPNVANRSNPAEKLMPFGKTKGKALGDHTDDELMKTRDWCLEKDPSKFKDLIDAIEQVVEDRTTMMALTPPEDTLPF